MMPKKLRNKYIWAALLGGVYLSGCRQSETEVTGQTVKEVVDRAVTRIYDSFTPAQMDTLSAEYILSLFSPEEQQVLATKYWEFDVNVPVRVSVMRHTSQKKAPFWLESSGFSKTALSVKNDSYEYEVWQKEFSAGRVNLGINGFDKHRPVYFVSVKGLSSTDSLQISPVYPEKQHFEKMGVGAFTYHDWDGLTLTEVPEDLTGDFLLTTIRGRAREAHLVGAFRDTPHPSSDLPDQVLLTWSGDPKTSQDIQWRTSRAVEGGMVQYWKLNSTDTLTAGATSFLMEDRLLRNDRYVHRHTVKLKDLSPGTSYSYRVGNRQVGWSDVYQFDTEKEAPGSFTYIWFGDTHHSPIFGNMLQKTAERHPEVSFYQIAGDLVSTGLYRDDWDKLFGYSGKAFARKPLMSIPGNHDNQDGLGAWMYKEMFSFPENGPDGVVSEMTYAYQYGNALFLMIDATQSIEKQTAWLEKKLSETKADWKLVMFHFPPYNFEEPYPEIIEAWGPLFDQYHVDIVSGGHMHYYLRTKPMYANKPVSDPSQGTIFMMSISIEGKQERWPEEDYAVVRYPGGPLYQYVTIDGKTLTLICYDPDGNIKDKLSITKK